GARVFGLSTQDTAYQREMVDRVGVPFQVLSDEQLALARALNLPTMEVAGQTLLKRIAWIARDGTIERVFYPVFPPNENANEVLAALRG
ncbi:MAG TPA: redoxin family protein, partial [Candidatus Elarobacter sp.]|nr:redoxin family protein [Candidatus Elarobacter sp.]